MEIIGEYAIFDLDTGVTDSGILAPDKMHGGYIQTNYHFWFETFDNTFLGRGFADPTFTLACRLDRADIADDGDANVGDNEESRVTIGLNYRPVETWVFKSILLNHYV